MDRRAASARRQRSPQHDQRGLRRCPRAAEEPRAMDERAAQAPSDHRRFRGPREQPAHEGSISGSLRVHVQEEPRAGGRRVAFLHQSRRALHCGDVVFRAHRREGEVSVECGHDRLDTHGASTARHAGRALSVVRTVPDHRRAQVLPAQSGRTARSRLWCGGRGVGGPSSNNSTGRSKTTWGGIIRRADVIGFAGRVRHIPSLLRK